MSLNLVVFVRFMNSKRSRLDADAFQKNCTSNKRRVPDSSDGDTSVSPDGEGHFGELALIFVAVVHTWSQWFNYFHCIAFIEL